MEEEFYDVLYGYLTRGVYPSEYDINKKRSLRRKAVHYTCSVDNGELFYIGGKRQPRELSKMKKKKDAFWKAAMPKQEVQLCINRLYATLYLNVAFLCRRSPWSGQNIRKSFFEILLGGNEQ